MVGFTCIFAKFEFALICPPKCQKKENRKVQQSEVVFFFKLRAPNCVLRNLPQAAQRSGILGPLDHVRVKCSLKQN